MERYIGQKAQQALEALTTEDSLSERLATARMHLLSVIDFLQGAPDEVQMPYRRQRHSKGRAAA